ncbi:MAG: Na+/H+ antiporter NhaA [Burkholderiales bacterium]
MGSTVRNFLRLEAAGGILLFVGALMAMLCANSRLELLYAGFLDTPVEIRVGAFHIAKPLLLWINDGLMAVFFLLVGLELKREMLEGRLSQPSQVALPALAAAGGMLVPGLIYIAFNWGDAVSMRGWAIPTATDIAFAVGVLALLGGRVPPALKLFVLTLAILDDLGAILVIAFFYTDNLALDALGVAAAAAVLLALLNRRGVVAIQPYLFIGLVMWAAVLKSGVHATLAGVALAMFIPLRVPLEEPPLGQLERELHAVVSFGILPLFAFANSGVSLQGVTLAALMDKAPAGIGIGLVLGKLVGVFGASWIAIRLGLGRLPEGVGWLHLLGAALLCGIGFTMSLFIAALAFQGEAAQLTVASRLGILLGSMVAGLGAYLVLRFAPARMH